MVKRKGCLKTTLSFYHTDYLPNACVLWFRTVTMDVYAISFQV